MDSGANGGGSGSDSDSEEQEDPSSSLQFEEAIDAFAKLNTQNKQGAQAEGDDDELSTFRQQWQRELEAAPPQNVMTKETQSSASSNPLNKSQQEKDYDEARGYFNLATQLERAGCWYESISNYKRAMAIFPNIEDLLYQENLMESKDEVPEEEEVPIIIPDADDDDEEAMVEGEDLVSRIQRLQAKQDMMCQQETPMQGAHISWLPYEVISLITRWVVSSDLDAISLERLGATCRGFYLVARDQDIWRNICVRTWGVECGTPRSHDFGSWRQMYVERPRLLLHGCYISKTNYLRHGESGFQDQYYRPWFLVQYYRYLRFFPEGLVMMLTTPDEPGSAVGQLRSRHVKPGQGLMVGHYRLRGDKVVIILKKSNSEKKPAQGPRFRSKRREPEPPEREQSFHIELQLSSFASSSKAKERRNTRLSWKCYSVCNQRDQDQWTQFELCPGKFPAFSFSRVRHYTKECNAPLVSVAVELPPPSTTVVGSEASSTTQTS